MRYIGKSTTGGDVYSMAKGLRVGDTDWIMVPGYNKFQSGKIYSMDHPLFEGGRARFRVLEARNTESKQRQPGGGFISMPQTSARVEVLPPR